jgi:Ca2+-binding RTX toxin-like protein
MRKLRLPLLAVCAATAALPAGADAAVSCDYDAATKQVDVTLTADGNYARIQRDGTDIRVSDALCLDGQVKATLDNTDKVVVDDTSGGATTIGILLLGNGRFGPGATNEGDGTSEIEFSIDGGAGADTLQIVGGHNPDRWRLGETNSGIGANLNAADEFGMGADSDVAATGINKVTVAPGDGDDNVSALGLPPFGGPVDLPMELFGGDHDDTLVGGQVGDFFDGGTGTDTLHGGYGDDVMRGDQGNDAFDGDDGLDVVDYQFAKAGVRVDLRNGGFQDTVGEGVDKLAEVENLAGSKHADVLTGDGGDNRLVGRDGDDVLAGNGGDDALDGDKHADTVSYADAPSGVKVTLGVLGQQNTFGAGKDTLADVESLTGSAFADVLTGDDGPNVVEGGAGGDQVAAKGGADTLKLRDGEADTADCGAGDPDTAITDETGIDTLGGCEAVDALPPAKTPADPVPPPVTPQPLPEQPGQPTQPSGGAGGDRTAPVLSALRRRGGRIVFRSSEKARVSVLIVRDRGRRSRPRFRAVHSLSRAAVAGRNRVALPKRLRNGRYRAVVVATDAAGNRSKKVRVTFRIAR